MRWAPFWSAPAICDASLDSLTCILSLWRVIIQSQTAPRNHTGKAKILEIRRIVILNPRRQNVLLPCWRRQLQSLQLADDFQNAVAPTQLGLWQSHAAKQAEIS